jgi:prefoldin subunit 5
MKSDRGSNDLEQIIEQLKKRIEELEADREILKKDIDRLSEYSHNLETMLRSNK